MKLLSLLSAAALVTLAQAATSDNTVAKDCTVSERQAINVLLDQDANPAKACYDKVKAFGDVLTLSTVRLCPVSQCKQWIAEVAENAPDCVYDDSNIKRQFKDKNQDCLDPVAAATKTPTPAPKNTKTPAPEAGEGSGLGSEAGVVETPKPTTAKPKPTTAKPVAEEGSSSGSSDTEIEPTPTEDTTISFPEETPEGPAATPAPRVTVSSDASHVAAGATVVVATALALVL